MLETIIASDGISHPPSIESEDAVMLSLNHSDICLRILKKLIGNEVIEPLPELMQDIANGLARYFCFSKGADLAQSISRCFSVSGTLYPAIEVVSI